MAAKNKSIKLIAVNHPVDNSDRNIHYIPWHRQRLRTLQRKYMSLHEELIIHVNQNRLTKDEQKTCRLKPGDEVIMVPALRAGIVTGIGAILVAFAKAAAFKYGLGWYIAANVAIAVGTGYIISALGPKPETPKFEGLTGGSQSFGFNPQTVQKQGLVISRNYGENKCHGNIVSTYTVASGEDETIYLILGLGEGPVEGIVSGSIRINGQPVDNFDGVTTYERKGTFNQTAIFNQAKPQYRPERIVTNAGGAEVWTTPDNDYDELEITLEYRICHFNNAGGYSSSSMGVRIEISEHDEYSWSTLLNTTINNNNTTPQKTTFISSGTYTGGSPVTITNGKRYDVRVTKTTGEKSNRYLDELKISAVREVIDTAFVRPGLSQLGIEALATGQISGSIDVSCIQQGRVINVFNGTYWNIEYSTNPAWVIWDIMTQPVISGDGGGTAYAIERYDGIDPSRLTPHLSEFYAAAQWFDQMVSDGDGGTEPRISFNGQFDTGTNMWDAVKEVCKMARCEVVPDGVNYNIIVDKAWNEDPVQLFSAGNIKPGTFKRPYLKWENRASLVELFFLDAAEDYSRDDPVVLHNIGINNPTKIISQKGFGIIKRSQAWRHAYWLLAKNLLIKSIVSFDADIDAIACIKGDVVYVASPWKKDGRALSCPADNQVELDKEPTSSDDDTILVRVYDSSIGRDRIEIHTVSSVSGAIVTITDTWTVKPKAKDVYAFGPTDVVTQKFRIIGITEKEELVHTIIAAEYHDGLYTGDDDEPVLPIAEYVTPQSAPDRTRMITLADLRREYPKEMLGMPNVDIPLITNLQWNDDTPGAGSVSWSATDGENPILFTYKGITYEITAGNTSNKHIYWDLAASTVFSSSANSADMIGANKWPVCINDSGTASRITSVPVLHGGIIRIGTIVAGHLYVLGLDSSGQITGDRLVYSNASLLKNWLLDIPDSNGRPAGIYPNESISDFSQLDWLDSGKTEIKILSTPDTGVSYGFPAIPIDDKQKYTVVIRHKSSAASIDGLYLRISQYNAALPATKTHIGSASGGANTQLRTNYVDLAPGVAMPGTNWTVNSYTYTPTAGTKYASFGMMPFNPDTAGVEYHVDNVLMYVVPKTAAEIAETDALKWAAESGADITGDHEADIALANLGEKSVDSLIDGTYAKMLAVWKHGSDPTKLDLSKGFAASITTAQIGLLAVHTAQINELAVDTLQIAGNAVTLGVSAYTEAGGVSGDVQTLEITTTGQPVNIAASVRIWAAGDESWWRYFTLLIKRGDETIYDSDSCFLFAGSTGKFSLNNVSFREIPDAGTYTYKLNITGTGITVGKRFLFVQEVKK